VEIQGTKNSTNNLGKEEELKNSHFPISKLSTTKDRSQKNMVLAYRQTYRSTE
jgi:hypothetical protein